ncbi:MAG: AtpZ/AtpI family protein [Chloroflexota bacterium]|nr:AtpZ/AtpI family protein [Chloroflexota bacterium]
MGRRWAESLRFIGIGWYIAASVLLGTLGGRWIGQQIGGSSEAIFTVVGLGVGLMVAFLGVYRMLKPLMQDKQDGDEEQ